MSIKIEVMERIYKAIKDGEIEAKETDTVPSDVAKYLHKIETSQAASVSQLNASGIRYHG